MSAADGCAVEDPYLFIDKRGHWHVIYHAYNAATDRPGGGSLVSLHHFSGDGLRWRASPTPPYTNEVQWADGSTSTVATRERPKLILGQDGTPTALVTAVCSVPSCGQSEPPVNCKSFFHDYTLVQPLRTVPASHSTNLKMDDDGNYTLVFSGGHNGTTGQRFDFTSGIELASAGYNSSVSAKEALRRCEALCSRNPCCVGLTLTDERWNGGGHGCHTVNTTDSVGTGLACVSYQRPPAAGCKRPPLATPAPVRFPIRGWSITCGQGNPNRSALYPGVNLLMEGVKNTRELAGLYGDDVAVLARRDVEEPFSLGAACRFNHSAGREACIDLLAEQYNTTDIDKVGTPAARWSGVGLDE
jgi:hypothetical protein